MQTMLGIGPTIREVRDGDRDGLVQLWNVTWSSTYGPLIGQPAVSTMLEGLDAYDLRGLLPSEEEDRAAVAVIEGAIVGSAIMAERGRVGHLWGMYVHPSHQRQGLGTALLRHVAGRLVHASTIEVRVLQSSPWAVAFYERCGFAERSREPMPLGAGLAPVPGLVMSVALEDLRNWP